MLQASPPFSFGRNENKLWAAGRRQQGPLGIDQNRLLNLWKRRFALSLWSN